MADRRSLDLQRNTAPRSGGEATNKRDNGSIGAANAAAATKKKGKSSRDAAAIKRRCVSTACIACRKRKSKCDGNTPSCAACSSVYGTECIYDPGSDHRRKGVYKDKTENLKARESTLQTIVQAILNYDEEDVPALVRQIRSSDSLDEVADSIIRRQMGEDVEDDEAYDSRVAHRAGKAPTTFENELSGKMGGLTLDNGAVRFLGGTSNLIYLSPEDHTRTDAIDGLPPDSILEHKEPVSSWTTVTNDETLILHLLNMYISWHYPFFTCLSKSLFQQDFLCGRQPAGAKRTSYCSSLLVNAMLALGCHFTSFPGACSDPNDPATKGDHFFAEAKRLIVDNDEYEKPRLTTVQALALMSVREAGCGREAKGWVYSGMSFRMALDMGLNLDVTTNREGMGEKEVDARRVTFWGIFLFDKCWSNYLGRLPQLLTSNVTAPKIEVFPDEEADVWSPFTDQGVSGMHAQPARTRAVALQITALCEISSDLLSFFYHPTGLERPMGKGVELKRLGELHTRLETWRRDLPREFEIREGQLPNVLLMHMFNHLLYIHLFRPFLKYSPTTSPLPSHVSPRKLCTSAAAQISKLMRLYKRTYGLRQICNIAVYIVHSACTIHLLNLPLADARSECALDKEGNGEDGEGKATSASEQVGKAARRDIVHGVRQLEEIAEDWLCSRRTLSILSVLARKWKIELPEEARLVLERTDKKYGTFSTGEVASPSPSPSKEANFGYEGPRRTSPFGARADEGVEFGGHGGAGCDRGRFGGTNVGDMVQGFHNGITLTQHSSPYESQLATPILQQLQPQQHVQQQQSPSSFGNEGQFANFKRFSPNRMSPGMQNPQQHQIPQHTQIGQQHGQKFPHTQAPLPPLPPMPPMPPFTHSQQFQQQYSRPMSATSAPSPNLATLTPGIQSVHGTPISGHLSPATMFNQVGAMEEAGVSSQDWWLRDQAQIAVGFGGWEGGMATGGLGTSMLDQMGEGYDADMPNGTKEGVNGEFLNVNSNVGGNGHGGQGYGENGQGGNGGNGWTSGNGSVKPSPGLGGWYGL